MPVIRDYENLPQIMKRILANPSKSVQPSANDYMDPYEQEDQMYMIEYLILRKLLEKGLRKKDDLFPLGDEEYMFDPRRYPT